VTMDSGALKQFIDWNARAKRLAAVIAARTKRGCRFLRTIVNGIRIRPARTCRWRGVRFVWTGPDRLVVDAGRYAAPLARRIISAIVVGIESDAVLSSQLGNERSIRYAGRQVMIRKQNWIERDGR